MARGAGPGIQEVFSSIAGTVTYGYDAAWRLTNITAPGGAFNLTYSPTNGLIAKIACFALDGAYTFDILDRIKRMQWTSGANVVRKYDYDSMTCVGRDRLSAVATEGTPAETYGYDRTGC